MGTHVLRRKKLLLGGAFADSALLDGEFDEFFLQPLSGDPARRAAAVALLKSFDTALVDELSGLHARTHVPVKLVWGALHPLCPRPARTGHGLRIPERPPRGGRRRVAVVHE